MKHIARTALILVTFSFPAFAQQNADDGGPDYYEVHGVGADALNIRSKPTAKAAIMGRVADGTFLKNGGCATYEGQRWCEVTVFDSDVKGWVFGKYLREGSPPPVDAKVAGTPYNATGEIKCVPIAGAAEANCSFGVIRSGDGNAVVEITLPDGKKRKIWFEKGKPVASDFGFVAQPGAAVDETMVTFPTGESFKIIDAIPSGG